MRRGTLPQDLQARRQKDEKAEVEEQGGQQHTEEWEEETMEDEEEKGAGADEVDAPLYTAKRSGRTVLTRSQRHCHPSRSLPLASLLGTSGQGMLSEVPWQRPFHCKMPSGCTHHCFPVMQASTTSIPAPPTGERSQLDSAAQNAA